MLWQVTNSACKKLFQSCKLQYIHTRQTFHFQERSSLLRRLGTFNDLEVTLRNSGDNDLEEPVSITGLETFSLSYKVFSSL